MMAGLIYSPSVSCFLSGNTSVNIMEKVRTILILSRKVNLSKSRNMIGFSYCDENLSTLKSDIDCMKTNYSSITV